MMMEDFPDDEQDLLSDAALDTLLDSFENEQDLSSRTDPEQFHNANSTNNNSSSARNYSENFSDLISIIDYAPDRYFIIMHPILFSMSS